MNRDLRESRLRSKIFGALVGAAIGDAFCVRTELMHYRDIEAQYGRVTDFEKLAPRRPSREPILERFNPFYRSRASMETDSFEPVDFTPLGRWGHEVGVYTDDTRYRLLVYNAIVRKRGPIAGADLASEWFRYRLAAEGATELRTPSLSWDGPEKEWARMLGSLPALSQMATATRPCIAGWDGPLGVVHAGDPEGAAAVGSSMAVGIATALMPDATIETMIEQMLAHVAVLGAQALEFTGRVRALVDIAHGCDDVFALREPFYREFLVSFPPWEAVFTLEMVPCALSLLVAARGDAAQAIVGAANMGRDADTIGALVGELAGALEGVDAFPAAWVDKVMRLNPEPDLAAMADELTGIVLERARAQEQRARAIVSLGPA